MTVLIICLFIAAAFPILMKAPVALAMHKLGGYDNNNPREQQARLAGFGARALAAHKNAFESLAIFAPAVLLVIATNNVSDTMEQLAIVHIVARIVYSALYLRDIASLRSVAWGIGFLSSLAMMYLCIP